MKQDGRVPRLPVLRIDAVREAVPLRFLVPFRQAVREVGVLHRRHAKGGVLGMVQCGETVSPTVAAPVHRHARISCRRPVVLRTGGVPPWSPRNVSDVVKLSHGKVLDILPRVAVVGASVRASIRGKDELVGTDPLQVVLVGVHLVGPPLRPHPLPRHPPVEGVPQLHPQDGDVVEIPRVQPHFGEVPTKPTEDAVWHGPLGHQFRPSVAVVSGSVQVAELQVGPHGVDHKPALRFLDADATTFFLAPRIGNDVPRFSAVQASVDLVVRTDKVARGRRPDAMP